MKQEKKPFNPVSAKIVPFLLLGKCITIDSSNDSKNQLIGYGPHGMINRDAQHSNLLETQEFTSTNKNCVLKSFKMYAEGAAIGTISQYIVSEASPLECIAANLVYATIFHKNLGAWRRLVSLYFSAYGLAPSVISKTDSINRISYYAAQYKAIPCSGDKFFYETQDVVTVIIPVHNASKTLSYSIDSIVSQTHHQLDIIIVDDKSEDNSLEIAKRYQENDKRIKVISLNKQSGPYVCRNIALTYAKGKYVTCHDADDWSHPDRIKIQLFHLLHNKKTASICFMLRITEDGRFTRASEISDICYDGLLRLCFSSLLICRETLVNTYGQWDSVLKAADSELIERIKTYAPQSLISIKKPLVLALDSPKGLSSELSNPSDVRNNERNDYKISFKNWHQSTISCFPLLKSASIQEGIYNLYSRHFKCPPSFAPPSSIEYCMIPAHKGHDLVVASLDNAHINNLASTEEDLVELSSKDLWHFVDSLLDNMSQAVEKVSTLEHLQSYMKECKRQGLLALIVFLYNEIALPKKLINKSIQMMHATATKQLESLGYDVASIDVRNIRQILYAQRDVLVLDALNRSLTDPSVAPDSTNKTTRRHIVLVINSLGPGGAEKQFVSWCNLLNSCSDPSFSVTAIIFNSAKNHNLNLLKETLDDNQIIFLDQTPLPTVNDFWAIAPKDLKDSISDRLNILTHISSRTRLHNTLKLALLLNLNQYDAVIGFLDEPFICSLLASMVIRPIKCMSRFGSMPRLIGRELTFREKWKARNRYSLYSHLPESTNIAIGANSANCLLEYHRIINLFRINRSCYVHLPNVVSTSLLMDSCNKYSSLTSYESSISQEISAKKLSSSSFIVVGSLMRLSEEKRPLTFLSIAEKLATVDILFLLIGSGPLDDAVARALKQSANPYILHIPTTSVVAHWYSLIDILCLTSKVEGSPNVLIEGALFECALFSTNVGGVSEIFTDKENAIIVDPHSSIEEMSNRLSEVLEDQDARLSLAKNAKSVVQANHNGDNLLKAIHGFVG